MFAFSTGDVKGDPESVTYNVASIGAKVAAALGTKPSDVLINDMAVNPASGKLYLSVSRGLGPDAIPVILRVDSSGTISEFSLKGIKVSRADLPNPPAPGGKGRRNKRAHVITDMAYVDGRVIIAGLSNEEFASKLRAIPFPFKKADAGTSVEVFHGAHGKFETRSPVRTFAIADIGDELHVLAAYTCTPLVRFPLKDLAPGKKVRGITVAELGNRNRPLDMVIYKDEGKDFVLLSNSARGVMKISTDEIVSRKGITKKVSGKAGQPYETIKGLTGVVQLDRLNKTHAVILVKADDDSLSLKTVPLP